ncbi:hypothetical protein BXY75_3348 [Ulvibacter antarcticus]|uniref:Uncharacterized protein n=1 Tax=Ulvibacter antarcticus TaxID=442714 RepID=A0A3L9YEY3_9FLAO|nr:hypothetical protein BXY75_3348 [Ulvibacter antarcticus]
MYFVSLKSGYALPQLPTFEQIKRGFERPSLYFGTMVY